MPLNKPFRRIYRPVKDRDYGYLRDNLYAENRLQLSRAYLNIERKLKDIFDYIEPAECNLSVFSFELYSLMLRACTEVELNCKAIMEANGVEKDHFSMNEYVKLEKSSKLSQYTIKYKHLRCRSNNRVSYNIYILRPFEQFGTYWNATQRDGISPSPKWYLEYNDVKHNREQNFELATLDNCMNAVAAILVLLYSQFGSDCMETNKKGLCWEILEEYYQPPFLADVIFELQSPVWTENDCYDFDWKSLKIQDEPFDIFHF